MAKTRLRFYASATIQPTPNSSSLITATTDYWPTDYSLSPFLIVPRGFFGKEDATDLRADTKRARCAGATRRISSINSRTQYSSAYCRLVGRAAALTASGFSERRINLNNFTVAWLGTV